MGRFESETEKKLSVGLPSLLKIEYQKKDGKFDADKYSKALENFHRSFDKIGIPPFEEFLIIGVENLHLLSEEHQKMLEELAIKIQEAEFKSLPNFMTKFIESLKEWKEKPENVDVIKP